jgi:hypothetical protein
MAGEVDIADLQCWSAFSAFVNSVAADKEDRDEFRFRLKASRGETVLYAAAAIGCRALSTLAMPLPQVAEISGIAVAVYVPVAWHTFPDHRSGALPARQKVAPPE